MGKVDYETGTIVVLKHCILMNTKGIYISYIGGFDGYEKRGTDRFVKLKSAFTDAYCNGYSFENNVRSRIYRGQFSDYIREATKEEKDNYFKLLNKEKGCEEAGSRLLCSISFDADDFAKRKPNLIEDDVNGKFSLVLREIKGEPHIFLFEKDANGLSSYSQKDFVTAININKIIKHLKLTVNK